jgi:hypothetical protein
VWGGGVGDGAFFDQGIDSTRHVLD